MERRTIALAVVLLVVFTLARPASAQAISLSFIAQLFTFGNDFENTSNVYSFNQNGQVVIGQEGQALLASNPTYAQAVQGAEQMQSSDPMTANLYKSYLTSDAAMKNANSSYWQTIKAGAEVAVSGSDLEMSGAGESGGPSLAEDQPAFNWLNIGSDIQDAWDGIKTLFGGGNQKSNTTADILGGISQSPQTQHTTQPKEQTPQTSPSSPKSPACQNVVQVSDYPNGINLGGGVNCVSFTLNNGETSPWVYMPQGVEYNFSAPGTPIEAFFGDGEQYYVGVNDNINGPSSNSARFQAYQDNTTVTVTLETGSPSTSAASVSSSLPSAASEQTVRILTNGVGVYASNSSGQAPLGDAPPTNQIATLNEGDIVEFLHEQFLFANPLDTATKSTQAIEVQLSNGQEGWIVGYGTDISNLAEIISSGTNGN